MKAPIRNSNKADYLKNSSNSGLGNLKAPNKQDSLTKIFPFSGGVELKAHYEVISAEDVESKTIAHPLNIRNQAALSLHAVRDIYPSIKKEGIKVDGIAIRDNESNRLLLIDSSRRRFCAIEAKKPLPLWVFDDELTIAQIMSLMRTSQDVKKWSWREEGKTFILVRDTKHINNINELAKELGIGRETVRKKVQAAEIDECLIDVFVDSEGIPSSFYASLAKLERTLLKASQNVQKFVKNAMTSFNCSSENVDDIQRATLDHLLSCYNALINVPKNEWKQKQLASFNDKKKYARLQISPDGVTMKIELSRLGKAFNHEVEEFIRSKLETLSK